MGIGISILVAIGAAVAAAVIVIVYFTVKKLKELLRARLERRKKSKVAFGSMRKVVSEHGREILAQAPSLTMTELEKAASSAPYFIVDYDPVTDDESDFTMIQAEDAEEKIEELFYENEGIVLFD